MQRSPLPETRVTELLLNYREHRPGRGTAARVRKHLTAAVAKLLRCHRDALAPCVQQSGLLHPLVPIGKGRNAGVPKVGPQPQARGRDAQRAPRRTERAKPRGRKKTTGQPELPAHNAEETGTCDTRVQAQDPALEFEARCLHLLQGVGPVTFPVAPQPPTFALRKPELCSGVPDVTVPVKYKSCELKTPPLVKCREVLRQALHPFKPAQRHLGRCLSVLWKLTASQPSSIEFVAMPELRRVIQQWRAKYCVSGSTVEGAFGELDIEEMFPNVQRSEVPTAVRQFYADACTRANAKAGDLVFALHPGGLKQLDCLRRPRTRDAYICYSITDIYCMLAIELLVNDEFVHCTSIFRQLLGLAIGGCMSAQGASLAVLHRERALPKHTLPPMVRYRDNYLLLVLRVQGEYGPMEEKLRAAMSTLSSVIGMTLKIENLGPVIPFLEATLSFDSIGLPDLRLRTPTFEFTFGMSSPPSPVRMVDAHSPSAKGMLRSYVPSVVLKCQSMGFCNAAFSDNVYSFTLVCLHKHYPGEWWKPQLISISDRYGLGTHARRGISAAQTD